MDTIGSIDKADERQCNVSDNIASQLLHRNPAKRLKCILSYMNVFKTAVKQIRKEGSGQAVVKHKREEECWHSCTELWSELLTLVKLKW
ncbi:hypothetical protein ERJ75_001110100 [Trypanosoma vivax]|nr:hypothetical protein ERJ75_001110100 [Trypanosoma vivax]